MEMKNNMRIFGIVLLAAVFLPSPVAAKKVPIPTDVFGSPEGPTRQKVEDLDGRDVVVRLYNNWQEASASFEKATVEVNGRTVRFDFNDVDDSAVVAVFGEDQKDELVRQLIGDRIYGWAYKKGLEFSLPEKATIQEGDYWWIFNDALGNPIPNATVEIYLAHEERQILIGQGKTDSQAQLKLPFCLGYGEVVLRVGSTSFHYGTVHPRFVVSHPDYGTTVVGLCSSNLTHTLFIPAVQPGSEADRRSIWGVVVDPDKNPVSGILIRATCVYPLGADLVCGIPMQNCSVPTDEEGRFRLYLPTKKDNEKIGTLIPPKAKYYVMIKPPKRLGLLPFKGKIPNGQETIITLEENAGYFRTFVFEDENGPIADPNQLRQIMLYIERPGKRNLWFKYDNFKAGEVFPLGTYEAKIDRPLREYKFGSIEVTADSPKQLVFKPSTSKLYYGQVVNGITGEPMPGVFVIDMDGSCSQRNLSMHTLEQWDALHDLPANPSAHDKGVAQLRNYYSFTKLVQTDDNGCFEMTVPPKRDFYELVVFEENYLSVFVPKGRLKPDDDGGVAVPVTKLFPAAKVIVEPRVEGWDRGLLAIYAKWIIDKNDNPVWVQDFLAGCKKGRHKGIRKEFSLRPNKPQSFYVPAGLNLHIILHTPYNKEYSSITIAEHLNVQQGETLDLGRQEIQLAVKVFVKVTDSTGSPVEGLPVTALSGRYGGVTHNTDENGVVQFDMAQYSQGEFVVEYDSGDDPNAMHLREAIPYEITGPEDANSVYILQVSDEMLYHLFK